MANTLFQRLKGLLGKKELPQGQAMILKVCDSIHTFFMQFPIDVIFVDSNNKVIKMIPRMQPFRISGIYFKAYLAIELPAGIIEKTATEAGDFLSIV